MAAAKRNSQVGARGELISGSWLCKRLGNGALVVPSQETGRNHQTREMKWIMKQSTELVFFLSSFCESWKWSTAGRVSCIFSSMCPFNQRSECNAPKEAEVRLCKFAHLEGSMVKMAYGACKTSKIASKKEAIYFSVQKVWKWVETDSCQTKMILLSSSTNLVPRFPW